MEKIQSDVAMHGNNLQNFVIIEVMGRVGTMEEKVEEYVNGIMDNFG